MAQLRQLHLGYGLNITWIDTKNMLADPLTKLSVDPYLIDAVNSGRWRGASTKETIEAKEGIGQTHRLRKLRRKRTKSISEHVLESNTLSYEHPTFSMFV